MRTPLEAWRTRSAAMRDEHFSARVFEAAGQLDARKLKEIRAALETFGALHVRHTGIDSIDGVQRVLPELGFGAAEQFSLGGRTSEAWQTKWVAPGLRRLDFYPPDLYLLPNNEVQYQRRAPRWVMFACLEAPRDGGRAFLHSARAVEAELERTPAGHTLLAQLRTFGASIETGFLDRAHPLKAENYFQSWQERFETDDATTALDRARTQADAVWWREDEGGTSTLMTRVTLPSFWGGCLRFPRLALDAPSARNGHRRFPLGNGEELSSDQRATLEAAYWTTREGVRLERGDLVLFDNVRFGHSRESFTGTRDVVVAMAGEVDWSAVPRVPPSQPQICTSAVATKRYALPPASVDFSKRFTVRTFDCDGEVRSRAVSIRRELERHGAVLVTKTGLNVGTPGDLPDDVLNALGFGGSEAFAWGGFASGRTTRQALSRELRATDAYPRDLWLLPHNEVLYQRRLPARLLFFSAADGAAPSGGRTFVHSAERLEAWLRGVGDEGEALLASLRMHGFLIEMGFLDARHPEKASNYFRSWQDRFDTQDRAEAEARCRAATLQFDECWWREESFGCATLMTRIRVPAFHREHLLFPRIALDPPALQNGYRRYPRGDGSEFTDREVDLLLSAFLETREGVHYRAGDLLLVDNLRYGHSREAYEGERSIGVAMAGTVELE